MRGDDHAPRVTPSLLDRLIDTDPTVPDVPATRSQSVRDLRDAVRRDLEQLLNTRNTLYDLLQGYTEAPRSVAAYGVPDFSSFNITKRNRDRVRQLLETAIRTFEPRLKGVTVTETQEDPKNARALALHIEARLMMDPAPQPIAFDVVVPLHTRECQVKDTN